MKLCSDSETLTIGYHPDGITDAVNHRIVRIIE